jgi:thiamine pyridinylase
MRHILPRAAVLCVSALWVGACAPGVKTVRGEEPPTASRPLKAVLFPYIPDSAGDHFASLTQTLEKNFEQSHPGIDLTLVIDLNVDSYDSGTLNTLLGSGGDGAQVVEVDTLLLGDLVSSHLVQPVSMDNPGVLPTAWQAVTVGGTAYGVPTYLCSNVIYAPSKDITSAGDGQALLKTLRDIAPGRTPLASNYVGSWTLSGLYLDAWADTHSAAEVSSAYTAPVDPATMAVFGPIVNSCASAGSAKNPCLDGTYKDNDEAENAYAAQTANGYMGYTESLFAIRKAQPSRPLPTVISAPLGTGTHPMMFVDALVFNASCTGQCLQDAQAFAAYMSSLPVRSLIAFSQDTPAQTFPRYLLQARQDFYQASPASTDPMYQQYWPIVQAARPYPNQGFPSSRKALESAVKKALQPPPRPF